MARPGLMSNVKFKVLCRVLGLPRPYVRGLLEVLWDVAHESGNPVLGGEEGVEAAAEWPGEKGAFFSALRGGRWIDQREDGQWEIHDYWHHAPSYAANRLGMEEERRKGKACKWCGTAFHSPDCRALYCKPACRTAAWRSAQGDAVTDCDGSICHGDGVLTDCDEPPSTQHPAPSTLLNTSPNGEVCSEPAKPASEPAVPDPIVLTFPTVGKGGEEWHLRESKVAEYRESFPGVDVLAECRKARQWGADNPKKRKTATGMPAFLGRWLAKEQNSGRGHKAESSGQPPDESPEEYAVRTQAERQAEAEAKAKVAGGVVP